MTASERQELYDAAVQKYRAGEYGPISFQMRLRQLGVDASEVDALVRKHLDECAKNRRS